MSSFITAYIYTPIVKSFNQLTFHKAMFATLITFFIVGLWHGASWMFIIFGALHGLGLVINQYWRKTKIKINKPVAWFITFSFVTITLIFFRAESIIGANNISDVSSSKFVIYFIQLKDFVIGHVSLS